MGLLLYYYRLKIYRSQLIAAGTIEEEPAAAGEHGATTSSGGEHGATESSGGEHATASSGGEHATGSSSGEHAAEPSSSTEGSSSAAHRRAKRAIEAVYPSVDNNTPSFTLDHDPATLNIESLQSSSSYSASNNNNKHPVGGYLTLFQYAISTTALTALQALDIASNPSLPSSSSSSEIHTTQEQSANYHQFSKRAAPLDVSFTDAEKVFIYKVFLISGGLIITINSLIKMLNTKLAGGKKKNIVAYLFIAYLHSEVKKTKPRSKIGTHYYHHVIYIYIDMVSKVIIASRIINAIVLWSMCALPFSQLDAIVLLSVMMGSLILQGKKTKTIAFFSFLNIIGVIEVIIILTNNFSFMIYTAIVDLLD